MTQEITDTMRRVPLTPRGLLVLAGLLALLLGRLPGTGAVTAQSSRSENLVLVTLDGARWQEIFGGMDADILHASAPVGTDVTQLPAWRKYAGQTATERRERLMPFLWRTFVPTLGSIAGNRTLGSRMSVTNSRWFSYPGYSELLTGITQDEAIDSNDPVRNPTPSVLQFIRRKRGWPASQVATFASWDVFNAIVESEPGETMVNAGVQDYEGTSPDIRWLNHLPDETAAPWERSRYDVFTHRFAMDYLRRVRPHVLVMGLGEPDEWAHEGRYDRVLESLHRSDEYLAELWAALEGDPQYAGKTTVIITADHGRGRTLQDWRSHGRAVPGSDEIWMAIASPESTRRGEWRDHVPVYQNQVGATMAAALGLDLREQTPRAGLPLSFDEAAVLSARR